MEPIKLIPLHSGHAETWANGCEQYAAHLTYDIGDYLKHWPDAQPSVAFERADGEKYAHVWYTEGTVLHIPLLLADTEKSGMCKCMITLSSGDGRTNTMVFYGSVTEGIDSLGEAPSAPEMGVIEQVNAAAARAEAAAGLAGPGTGGSGSGIFFVHITTEDDETFQSDKTYAEILAALGNGQMAYACIMGAYYLPLVIAAEGVIIFSLVAALFDSVSMLSLTIAEDNTVTFESMQ